MGWEGGNTGEKVTMRCKLICKAGVTRGHDGKERR